MYTFIREVTFKNMAGAIRGAPLAAQLVAFMAILVSGNIYAQTWNYQGSQQHDAVGPSYMGQITLEKIGGEYSFQMQHSNLDPCYKSAMKASVERTQSTITITPTSLIPGCGPVRFVLKTDGTGGFREFLTDGQWRREEANRVLTLRK
jgi:hypothetical protein